MARIIFQTKAWIGEKSNVGFINGTIMFSSVKLNVYSFNIDGVLIDTGAPRLLKEFKKFFIDVDIDQVVISHSHEDHIGGAAYLQNEHGLPIYMNRMMIEECSRKANYPFYRKMFWGSRKPFEAQELGKTFTSRNAIWDVIETPGHAIDHLSFLNRETGQLFSGDLFVQPRTNVILREESIPTIMESITHVLTYDFGELFCCHAGYVKESRQALIRKLQNLKELEASILELHKQGYHEKEIQRKLFKKKYPITFFSFGEWDSIHIIRSIIKS
ncbi:MBL fold hydrolase [Ornithinibacillus bavariensis]|uniref:MBL fold hydrolase n=1 Tax=Ornithinibacillus bavariensis TaxID=545502 RepID=A0A920C6J5_9BACI|nr:MBL fold hydrolase [Ornithinibacillus bavariensis]